MKPIIFLWLIACTFLNTGAQLLLKIGSDRISGLSFTRSNFLPMLNHLLTSPFILLGLVCYGFSVIIWIGILSRVNVSIAYPLVSLGYVVNAIAAYYLLGEILTINRIIGIFFILIGVYCIVKNAS